LVSLAIYFNKRGPTSFFLGSGSGTGVFFFGLGTTFGATLTS